MKDKGDAKLCKTLNDRMVIANGLGVSFSLKSQWECFSKKTPSLGPNSAYGLWNIQGSSQSFFGRIPVKPIFQMYYAA